MSVSTLCSSRAMVSNDQARSLIYLKDLGDKMLHWVYGSAWNKVH